MKVSRRESKKDKPLLLAEGRVEIKQLDWLREELTMLSTVVEVFPLNWSVDEQMVVWPAPEVTLQFFDRFRLLLQAEVEVEDELLLEVEDELYEWSDEVETGDDRTLTNQIIETISSMVIVKPMEPIIAGARSDWLGAEMKNKSTGSREREKREQEKTDQNRIECVCVCSLYYWLIDGSMENTSTTSNDQ